MHSNDWAAEFNRRSAGSMIADHGTVFREVTAERAVLELAFKPTLAQMTGIFHAGAMIALADEACTALSAAHAMREGGWEPEKFPLTVQLSANLIRNTNRGLITAEAKALHSGRTTMVVQTEVRDEDAKLLAVVTATLILPSPGDASRAKSA